MAAAMLLVKSIMSPLCSRGNQGGGGGGVYRGLGGGSKPGQQKISPAERERAEQRRLDLMMKEIKETVDLAPGLATPGY